MALLTVVYALLVILSMSLLENADAQSPNVHDSFSVIKSLDGLTKAVGDLTKVVENLETKIETQGILLNTLEGKIATQATVLNNVEGKLEIQATLLNNWVTNASVQAALVLNKLELQVTVLNNSEAQVKTQATLINNLVANEESQTTSLKNLEVKEEIQATLLSKLETQVDIQVTSLNALETRVEMHATSLDNLVAKEKIQATSLKKLVATGKLQTASLSNLKNVSTHLQKLRTEVAELSEGFQQTRPSRGLVEGIIAGTDKGVVVIPLITRQQIKIPSNDSYGVAFDWSIRKVLWIEPAVGIRRSNLDGTSVELLIADKQMLVGLAVDTITGNIYYGRRPPRLDIRVCGRSGKNCAVVMSGADLIGHRNRDFSTLLYILQKA